MADRSTLIARARKVFWGKSSKSYEPVNTDIGYSDEVPPVRIIDDEEYRDSDYVDEEEPDVEEEEGGEESEIFSWFEYCIFLLLGVVMLWAWNMFLAAAPYFQTRFADSKRILSSFQPAITSVGCVTNLGSMLILGQLQSKANYPKRIISSLFINIVVFILLAISTTWYTGVSASNYLVFTLVMVFITSCATGLCQNGAFAFAASFGRPEYIQAIMTGQGIAGVLPSVAQIASVMAIPDKHHWEDAEVELTIIMTKAKTTSAFVYFLTATIISVIGLLAIFPLVRKHNRILQRHMVSSISSVEDFERSKRKDISMGALYKKLPWQASAVFVCFTITMFFPVFTSKVVSVIPEDSAPRLFRPAAFIPLGFLVWNVGDLVGRLSTLLPFTMRQRPRALLSLAILRVSFIPMYFLCNLGGKGAVISSDVFYLFFVQFFYGATNGWVSSLCMMAPSDYVEDGEREAAGGFMAVNLVAGLTAGSLLSFTASGVRT